MIRRISVGAEGTVMTVIAASAPMTVARSNVDKAAVLAAARAQVDAWKRAV